MSTQHEQPAGPGATGGDWWSRRPRRSGSDRKIAGVAGGLGRAFGVDPVLIRVAFVVLTVFGFGLTAYILCWLLLPADGDEVSPGEALLGRGRSATPAILSVVLAIGAVIGVFSLFSWGHPFWLLVVIGCVAILLARRRGRACGNGTTQQQIDQWANKVGEAGRSWGEQAEQWIARQPWSGPGSTGAKPGDQQSPFEQPAFWDETGTANQPTGRQRDQQRVNLRKDAPSADQPAQANQPPAWDPLGVAPFAWDLPEPSPVAPPPPATRERNVIGRITLGMVLLVGVLGTIGTLQGWWALSWAGVSALALTVVAVGLLISSLRGRGSSLIGPGIFLSLVTLALTITGISGTSGYGQQTWAPATVAAANQEFVINGGQGTLDLTQLDVPAGQTVHPDVTVRAGQATVIVPADANVNVTCTANAGEVDCLGVTQSGLQQQVDRTQSGSSDEGTIDLTVHVGAGQAQVRNG